LWTQTKNIAYIISIADILSLKNIFIVSIESKYECTMDQELYRQSFSLLALARSLLQ